jgi:hypothetical protein
LLHDVVLLVQDVVSDTSEVGVLKISIEVDLDDTIANGVEEFLLGRARSAVEDEENWLVLLGSNGILNVLLMFAEELWMKLNVSWLVDSVNVAKTSSDGEVWGNW